MTERMINLQEKELIVCKTSDKFQSASIEEDQNLVSVLRQNNDEMRNSELNQTLIRRILKDSKKKYLSNNFLMIAMVEFICNRFNSGKRNSDYNFNDICQQLIQLGLFDPMLTSDFCRPIRFEYLKFLNVVFNKTIPIQLFYVNRKQKSISNASLNQTFSQNFNSVSKLSNSKIKEDEFLKPYFFNLSRYKTDFEETEKLASGGFGSVYKAKNMIDQKFYAIKKIFFKNTNTLFCQNIIRETELFSTLDHENIVNYNSSWIELEYKEKSKRNFDKSSTDDQYGPESWPTTEYKHASQSKKSEDNDEFKRSRKNIKSDKLKQIDEFSINSRLKQISSIKESKDNNENFDNLDKKNFFIVLYIQMKLCDLTLKDWLKSRNESIFLQELKENSELNLKIFHQILCGVEYLHSKCIIHRDLKPGNIFMIKDPLRIKIGDFGLACLDVLNEKNNEMSVIKLDRIDHTKGVGTTLYASPEQLNGKIYDMKTDIYSLGIILFELYYPFNTEMERITLIRDLKAKLSFPNDLEKERIDECALIKKMLSEKSVSRPSAKDLLNSKLFMTKDQVIEQLEKILEEKNKEIKLLKNKLIEKENLINSIKTFSFFSSN